ncbi:hypothetical protein HY638_00330 [Candidatus Woesearchaeota archaeon]|nr:hypothetical protein [Candidatus Woesearchaeota archaeon]
MIIQYINAGILEPNEKADFESIVTQLGEKIERVIKNVSKLVVQVKLMSATGKRKQYCVTLRTEGPGAVFSADAVDWDLRRTVRKAVNEVEREITHRYKADSSYRKSYL